MFDSFTQPPEEDELLLLAEELDEDDELDRELHEALGGGITTILSPFCNFIVPLRSSNPSRQSTKLVAALPL